MMPTLHNIPYQNIGPTGPLASRASSWRLLPPVLALQIACGPPDRAFVAPDGGLSVDPASLILGPVTMESQAEGLVTITNDGALPVTLEPQLEGDAFQLDAPQPLTVPGVDSVELWVRFTPTSAAPASGRLVLDDTTAVSLTGLADPDGDDDGDVHPLAGGDDCDDTDPDIGPSTPEVWYDGIDQDCDGNDDDADYDGVSVDTDCDDHDASRYPGNTERWYDGIDQDCDGNDDDADYDGVSVDTDCDDDDPGIHPGHSDLADGVDEDCDGLMDEDGAAAGAAIFSELFPENASKPSGSDEYLELWIKGGRGLGGWELATGAGVGTITQVADAGGSWLLLCSEGLLDDQPACGATVAPWPRVSRTSDTIELRLDGVVIDRLSWDSSWGLTSRSLQLDAGLLRGTATRDTVNDALSAWCEGEASAGEANLTCP